VYFSYIFYNNMAKGTVNSRILEKDSEFDEFIDIITSGVSARA